MAFFVQTIILFYIENPTEDLLGCQEFWLPRISFGYAESAQDLPPNCKALGRKILVQKVTLQAGSGRMHDSSDIFQQDK